MLKFWLVIKFFINNPKIYLILNSEIKKNAGIQNLKSLNSDLLKIQHILKLLNSKILQNSSKKKNLAFLFKKSSTIFSSKIFIF